jgi:hypothetical protein
MLESILAVDSLAIQRSLTILEDRYRELREIGQKRFAAWEVEKTALQQQLAAQAETQGKGSGMAQPGRQQAQPGRTQRHQVAAHRRPQVQGCSQQGQERGGRKIAG